MVLKKHHDDGINRELLDQLAVNGVGERGVNGVGPAQLIDAK